MTLELSLYILLSCFTVFSVWFNNDSRFIFYTSFVLAVVFMVVVRMSGFDIDMNTYAAALDVEDFDLIYYKREFVYWRGASFIYNFLGDKVLTFISIDLIWITVLFFSLRGKVPVYSILAMVLFFPLLMGYQNVYRQLIASVFLLAAFFSGSRFKAIGLCILAIFIHNLSAVFIPMIALRFINVSSFIGVSMLIFSFLFVTVGSYLSLQSEDFGKSVRESENDLVVVYLFIFFSLVFFYLKGSKFKIKLFFKNYYFSFYCLLTFVALSLFIGNAQASRVGMVMLTLLLPHFLRFYDERVSGNQKLFSRTTFAVLMIAPTFIFSSAFNFLTTELAF